ADSDAAVLQTTGTATAPTELSLAGLSQFEVLRNASGVNALSGTANFQQVDVVSGRLIGRAGSALTGNVAVSNGATFGSAGTVNGNVGVASGGTLSPGASPGIMTVNGNVALASGSTTVFEFVPVGQSDQLLVNGAVSIASGTTVNLTGSLTPGASRDLIITTGGISGTFTNVNRDPGILGALRYTPTTLQLLGTFALPGGITPQTAASINYVNSVLIAGQASPALLAAVPSLLTGGGTNVAAFGQLHPEAYATATQIGVQHGLTLAKATRGGLAMLPRVEAGPFTFAQGMGDWRRFKGDAARGTSAAKSESKGVIGGIGAGAGGGAVAAFVGYLDSEQRIARLGAETEADGMVAGVTANFATAGFDLSILAAYDWSKARTERSVLGASMRSDEYKLRSTILDVAVGYNLPFGADWALRPQIGATYIETNRGATRETGSAAFALDVDRRKSEATFIDASLALRGGQAAGSALHPWAQVGV
ncbi:MAG: autotransporter protein, partial [Candidatus Accumulibacter sp.]|nr:autotransporter protein [Accumulibacter sp.]